MRHLLLTGAGFSHNWGGYLASEAFEYLLSITEADDDLRGVLWRDKQQGFGFEDTLTKLQHKYEKDWDPQTEQDLQNLTSAVQRMFADMARAFSRVPFEPQTTDTKAGVANFLARFDAIFTLNQDTLLESKYLPIVGQDAFAEEPHKAAFRPGIVRGPHIFCPYGSLSEHIELFKPDNNFVLVPNLQPYFKLHGSIDIMQSEREMMLIVGGNKARNISQCPLLNWYFEEFSTRLHLSNTRLMIIGYSFGDAHINKAIFSAIKTGLKIFIVDPQGTDVIGSNASLPLNPGFETKNSIIGASRRPFLSTISGRDIVEFDKIQRFFTSESVAVPPSPTLLRV